MFMKSVIVTMQVNPEFQSQAEIICDQMGLTLSNVYMMLLKEIVRTGSIPFEIKADSFQSEENQKHLKAAIARLEAGAGEEHNLIS